MVAPGETITMTWAITSDFAPTEDDPSCLPFSYHSHSDPEMGINSGLVGLLLVCKPGKYTHDRRPRDGIKMNVIYVYKIHAYFFQCILLYTQKNN